MSFTKRVLYGIESINNLISESINDVKEWCNNRFVKKSGNGFGNAALIEDSNGRITGSNISSAELHMLDGATSNIQQQINSHTSNTTVHVTSSEKTTWNGKADEDHTHPQSDITGLVSALAGKASTSHTHSASSIGAIGFPNYSSATTIGNNYTASANGWIQYEGYRYSTGWVAINGRKVCHYSAHFSEESDGAAGVAPISKGDKVTKSGPVTVRFLPMK